MDIFTEIGVLIILASVMAFLFKLLKQPLIPAYIFAGIITMPLLGLFGMSLTLEALQKLAEIGIAFLLFVVGMEIELKKLKTVGLVSSVGGTLVSLLILISIFFLSQLWLTPMSALYLGIIFSFSSTMVVVKLLSDKGELSTLHGRIAVGRLLMEDVLAILVLSFLAPSGGGLFIVLLKVVIIGFCSVLLARFILPYVFKRAASDQKLLFLLSLGVCFLFSILMAKLSLSIAIGGFLAGVILANTPYNLEIISHTKPVRDFFATLFFVVLGMEISFSVVGQVIAPILIFIAVLAIIKPLFGFLVCRLFGYTRSTSFLSAIALTQISEFSLIIGTLLFSAGRITEQLFSIIVVVAVVTITMTSYLVKYDYAIYRFLLPLLNRLDIFRKREKALHYMPENETYDTLLVGCDRLGHHILRKLKKLNKKVLVVDFNPEVIQSLMHQKVQCIYGDIGDIEIIERIDLKKLGLVISTSPDSFDNKLLMKEVSQANRHAVIITTAQTVESAIELYNAGSDYVIVPHMLGGKYLSILLEDFDSDLRKLVDIKLAHVEELNSAKYIKSEEVV